MKNVIHCFLVVVVLAGLFLGCARSPTPTPEPIVLEAVAFVPIPSSLNYTFVDWVKRVNEQAKGELVIDIIGGPEAMPAFDQFEAVRTGAVDLIHTTGYHTPKMPENMILNLTKLNLVEQLETGIYDFLVDLYEKFNIRYVGSLIDHTFYLYSNVRIENPREDFKGLRFRTGELYDHFMAELGITPVSMPMPDVYTALERGMVDGYGWSNLGVVDFGWGEVTEYRIDHPFYGTEMCMLVNLDKWNSIPQHLRDLMLDIRVKMGPEVVAYYDEIQKKETQDLVAAGVELIKFSTADAKWYIDTAYRARTEYMKEKLSPESFNRIMELLKEQP